MKAELIRSPGADFPGCDFVLRVPEDRPIRLLQLTDMQVIDAAQRRYPDRINAGEIAAWDPTHFDAQCGDHIRSLVAQTDPDLIFITGDIVYGSFDDNGSALRWFCKLMDSFAIPWAPVFGNHDNESAMGVAWQCETLASSRYCLFSRGNVSGNGNYTVGIADRNGLVRVLHMLDSNGCGDTQDPAVIRACGLYSDQLAMLRDRTDRITAACGHAVPAFLAFHIPTEEFAEAERAAGYCTEERKFYTIGVDVSAKNGDFGCKWEPYGTIRTEEPFMPLLKACHVDGLFAGHCHAINTCITYEGIRFVFGMKTGQYDYHIPGRLGGTLICLFDSDFTVTHTPSLCPYAPFPRGATSYHNFFT